MGHSVRGGGFRTAEKASGQQARELQRSDMPGMFFRQRGTAVCRLGLDIAGPGQGHFGQSRAHQFIDQDAEQDDAANDFAGFPQFCRHGDGHAQGDAGLGKQRDAQVFYNAGSTVHGPGAGEGADVFAQGTGQDVDGADPDDGRI